MIVYQAHSMKQKINVYFNLTTKGINNSEVSIDFDHCIEN